MFSDQPSRSLAPALPVALGSASPAAPAALTPAQAAHLAESFAREPELILACIEPDGEVAPTALATVLAAAREALRRRPDYADLYYYAACAAVQAGDWDEARELLGRALDLNPRYHDAMVLAAKVAVAQHRPDDAIAWLQRAVRGGAEYADVHVMLGDLLRERDEPDLARRSYEQALKINANLIGARLGLAALTPSGERGGVDELPA